MVSALTLALLLLLLVPIGDQSLMMPLQPGQLPTPIPATVAAVD